MELQKLSLQKFTFAEKLDFLQKFYTTQVWSRTVADFGSKATRLLPMGMSDTERRNEAVIKQ